MQKTYIGILLIVVVVVFLALRNAQDVLLDFWVWKVNCSLSLVIVLSVTFGALSGFFLSLPYRTRKNKEIKERDEQIKSLDNEILEMNSQNDKNIKDDEKMN